jgi:bifunctional non-homologous end joining protein LigD
MHRTLKNYSDKRNPGTNEPFGPYKNVPGTVYRSFVVKKHKIPSKDEKLFIVETEDHPIEYEFEGTIPEGYGAGTVSIYDKGTYEIISMERDKKYIINFDGNKLKGEYAFIKYKNGYLWLRVKNLDS